MSWPLVSTLPQLRLLPRSRSTWNQHLYLWKASTSHGGGRREVGGEGDKQRADLTEETIRVDWRAEELHLCHQCSSEQTSVLEKKAGKDCDEPAGEDPRPASAAHVPPGLRGVARQDWGIKPSSLRSRAARRGLTRSSHTTTLTLLRVTLDLRPRRNPRKSRRTWRVW